jgi:hypothetical protein
MSQVKNPIGPVVGFCRGQIASHRWIALDVRDQPGAR